MIGFGQGDAAIVTGHQTRRKPIILANVRAVRERDGRGGGVWLCRITIRV